MKKIKLDESGELIINFQEGDKHFLFTTITNKDEINFNITKSQAVELANYIIKSLNTLSTKERIDRLNALSIKLKADLDTFKHLPDYSAIVNALSEQPSKQTAEVFIGLPQNELSIFQIEKIQNACGEFMDALGFELETEDEPIYGSFFQRLAFLTKDKKTKEEVSDLYAKGKKALEYKYLNGPTAEATSKLSSAAAELISSVRDIDEVVLRLGSILLVKTIRNGQQQLIVETVSHELADSFDNNPNLLKNPSAIYEYIIGERNKQGDIDEGENLLV